jgi:hypothetical protein
MNSDSSTGFDMSQWLEPLEEACLEKVACTSPEHMYEVCEGRRSVQAAHVSFLAAKRNLRKIWQRAILAQMRDATYFHREVPIIKVIADAGREVVAGEEALLLVREQVGGIGTFALQLWPPFTAGEDGEEDDGGELDLSAPPLQILRIRLNRCTREAVMEMDASLVARLPDDWEHTAVDSIAKLGTFFRLKYEFDFTDAEWAAIVHELVRDPAGMRRPGKKVHLGRPRAMSM